MAPLAQLASFRRSTTNMKRFAKQLAATPLVGESPTSPGAPATWAEQVAARQVVMPVSARAYILRETFVIGEYPSLADEIDAFLVGGGAARVDNGAPPGELLPTISEPAQEAETNEVAIPERLPTPPATPRLDDLLPDTPTPPCKADSLSTSRDQETPPSAHKYAVYHKPNAFASRANLTPAPSGAFIVGDCSMESFQDPGRRQALVVPPMLPSPPPSPIASISSTDDLRASAGGSRDAGATPAVEKSADTWHESDKEASSPGAVQIQVEEPSGGDCPRFAPNCSAGVTAKAARPKFSQQLSKTWQVVRPAMKKRLAELEMVVKDIDARSGSLRRDVVGRAVVR